MNNYSCDILIIGGATAGLMAAVCAKEEKPDVDIIVADIACASKGWAGKASRGAGLLSYVAADQNPEVFMQYFLKEIGYYLNDQYMLREFAYNSNKIVEHLRNIGVPFVEKEDGTIDRAVWPFGWSTTGVDPDLNTYLAKNARQMGVRFIDHIDICKLIKSNKRIIGAMGFGINDGDFSVITAKETIIAAGSQNFDITPDWASTGNSQLIAWDAGAKFRNVEFCGMGDFARVDDEGQIYYGHHGGAHTVHDHLYANGENISQKWRPGIHSSMDPYAANAWYRESKNGTVDIYGNMDEFFSEQSGDLFRFHPKSRERDIRRETLANYPYGNGQYKVVPGVISEVSAIMVDHEMRTSLPGLFAIGDSSGSGSARGGAAPTPPGKIHGTGLMNALFMGSIAGRIVPECVEELNSVGYKPELSENIKNEIEKARKKIIEPLQRKEGVSPRTVINRVQDAIAPCDYIFIKQKERMEEALSIIEEAKDMLDYMVVSDYHELAKCIDAKSMVLCAELFYKASLYRTESRGFHYREDYPDTDGTWLKWIILENDKGKIKYDTVPVPIDEYTYKLRL